MSSDHNHDDARPLEDLPPTYTSVDVSAGNLGEQGSGSPVTAHL